MFYKSVSFNSGMSLQIFIQSCISQLVITRIKIRSKVLLKWVSPSIYRWRLANLTPKFPAHILHVHHIAPQKARDQSDPTLQLGPELRTSTRCRVEVDPGRVGFCSSLLRVHLEVALLSCLFLISFKFLLELFTTSPRFHFSHDLGLTWAWSSCEVLFHFQLSFL